MAKKDVETKVVQMRFDNQNFQKKINATIKSVNTLDDSLQFKGSKKELKELSEALDKIEKNDINKNLEKTESIVHKISVSFTELLKIKLLAKAIDTVTQSAMGLFKTITGFDNVIGGWAAYNESLTTIGGILNQVESQGKTLDDVTKAMEQLRWYADETSYSFQTMSDGIRQFVIAGVGLEDATSAVQGVANLAGSAKVFDPFKVQSAMDAIAKSMQTGYMDTMKWTTLTNTAGIVTQDFSKMLLEAAAAQGTLIRSGVGQYKTKRGGMWVTPENIRSTLSKRWLTNDVLTAVLGQYNSAAETVKSFMDAIEEGTPEAWKEVNKYFPKLGKTFNSLDDIISEVQGNPEKYSEQVVEMTKNMNANNITTRQALILMKELGHEFDEVSYKAYMSSQETTSFSQAVSYAAGSIKTSWQGIFQAIFGNVEEATSLWSDVSDKFAAIFVSPFNLLEKKFNKWSLLEEGGAKDFRKTILAIIDVIGQFKDAVEQGFRAVFKGDLVDVLQNVTLKLKDFVESLQKNKAVFETVTAISKIFAASLKIVGTVLKTIFTIIGGVATAFSPVFDLIAQGIGYLADGFVWLVNFVEEAGILKSLANGIIYIITRISKAIQRVIKAISSKIDINELKNKLKWIFDWLIDKIIIAVEWISGLIEKFAEWIEQSEIIKNVTRAIGTAFNFLKAAIQKIASWFSALFQAIGSLFSGEAFKKGAEKAKSAGKAFSEWFMEVWGKFVKFLEDSGIMKYIDKLKEFFITLGNGIATMFSPLVNAIKEGDIKTVIKWALGIATLIVLFKFIYDQASILNGYKKVLSSIADMFWAIEGRIRLGSTVKLLANSILKISAAIVVIAYAIGEIANIEEKYGLDSLITASIIIGVITGVIVGLMKFISVLGKNGLNIASVRSLTFFVGMALALSIAIKSVISAMKDINDANIDTASIENAIFILLSVTAAIALIVKASKSGKGIMPLVISFAKVLASIWVALKIAFWAIDKVKEYDPSTIGLFESIIVTLVGAIIVIFMMTKRAAATAPSPKATITIGSTLFGISIILIAMSFLMANAKGMTVGEIIKTVVIFTAAIAGVLKMVGSLIVMSSIPISKVSISAIKIGSTLGWISFSIMAMAIALKITKGLSWSEVLSAGVFILAMYALLGGLALGLTKLGQITSKTLKIGKFGKNEGIFSSKKAISGSPIGMTIFAITASVALMLFMVKYANSIAWGEFWGGFGKIALVLGAVFIVVGILKLIDKIPTRGGTVNKTVIKLRGTILAITIAIIGIALAIANLALIDENALIRASITVGVIAGAIAAMVFLLTLISNIGKHYQQTPAEQTNVNNRFKRMLTLIVGLAGIIGALWAVVMAIKMAGSIPEEELKRGAITVGVVVGVLVGLMAILAVISKIKASWGTTLIGIVGLGAIIGALWLLVTPLQEFAKLDAENLLKIGGVISLFLAILAGIVLVLGALGETGVSVVGVLVLLGMAAAIWILAKAMESAGPHFKEFSDMFSQVTLSIVSGVETILNAIYKFISGIFELFINAIKQINNEIERLFKIFENVDSATISKIGELAGEIAKLAGGTFLKALSDIVSTVTDLFSTIVNGKSRIALLLDILDRLVNIDVGAVSLAIQLVDKIKDLLDSDINCQPTITPVFDFSQYEAGILRMKNDFGAIASYYSANAVQNDYNNAKKQNYRNYKEDEGSFDGRQRTGESIIINNTQNFSPEAAYTYSSQRAIKNMLDDVRFITK